MSTSRPAMPHIEQVTINYTDVLGTNRLQYNTAVGVFSSNGTTTDLKTFLALIRLSKKDHLNTFFGGTLSVQQLDAPIFCYRTAENVGRYWTTTPPASPWQHALEMSMSPSIYPENMKSTPNYHPANKGVLIYEVPAGQIVVNGKCASLGGFPGMGDQIYMPHVPADQVRMGSWSQWKANSHLPHAYNIEWRDGRIVSLWSSIENAKSQTVINDVVAPLFKNFTNELSDLAIRNVGSATFNVVTEYGAAQVVATKNIALAVAPQPIKIWDVNHSALAGKNAYKVTSLIQPNVSTMNWRAAISEGRRAPWYQAVNYPALGGFALKIAAPPLMAWDAYHRVQNDMTQFPGYSNPAHGAAVATDMAVDYGMYAGLASMTSAGIALPLVALGNLGCEIANGIRDIPAEVMMNNRDFLLANIVACEFSPLIEQMLLDDFDNGGTKSRDFNRACMEMTKIAYKPFEWVYDLKKGISNTVRDIVDFPTHGRQHDESHTSANAAKAKSESSQLPEAVRISAEIDKYFDEHTNVEPSDLPSATQIVNLFNQQSTTNSGQVNFVERSGDKLLLNISMGTSLMTPDFHGFLFDMNRSPASSGESSVKVNLEPEADIPEEIKIDLQYKSSTVANDNQKKSVEKPVVPFISNVRLGKVGDKMGVIATIAGAAQVGVTASQDGFLVSMTAEFGAEFWSAMGAGLAVGAVVAGVLLLAKHFYSQHQKHISHKINSGIKRTNKEGEHIADALNRLNQLHKDGEEETNLQSLIDQTTSLKNYIRSRIEKEESRAHYAKKHGSKEGKKAHYARIDTYKNISYDLFKWHESLKNEQIRLNFINTHVEMKGGDLAILARNLIAKFATTQEAADASAKESNQPDVLAQVDAYIKDGYKLYKRYNGSNHGHHLSAVEAKQYLSNGGSIEAKKNHHKKKIQHYLSMPARTYSDADLANINGVRCLIVSELIGLAESGKIDEAKKLLAETSMLHQFGTEAANLQLVGLSNLLDKLSDHASSPPSHWINLVKSEETKLLVKEEVMLLKSMASHHLINHVIANAVQGKFETANAILKAIHSDLPELSKTVDSLAAKISQLQPHFSDVDYCLNLLASNNLRSGHSDKVEDVLEDVILKHVIKKDIFLHASEGDFVTAESRCDEYSQACAKSADMVDEYVAGIKRLAKLKGAPNASLLSELGTNNKAAAENPSGEDEIVSSTLLSWIYSNVFKSVLDGEKEDAVRDLSTLKQQVTTQTELSERLIQKIEHGKDNADKDEEFWLSEYGQLQLELKTLPPENNDNLDPEVQDLHAETVNSMGKSVAINALFGVVSDKGKRGFNREAANIVERLRKVDGTLDIKNIEDDFRFAHQEQKIGLFIRPAQTVLLKFTRGFKPSLTRSAALGALNLVNTVQIIAPNALSLSMQMLHAKCVTNDMCVANRSFNTLMTQVSKDINPFSAEYNPFNTENYFNGAMIYGQLLLKGAEYLPLKWVVSDKKLYNAEALRSSILSYGNLGVRGIHTATTMMQIRSALSLKDGLLSLANAPLLLVSLSNTAVDASYWAFHKYKASRGEAPENPAHYHTQEGVGSGLDTLAAIAFAGMITGGMGWLALLAGLVSGGAGVYSYNCEATTKDNAAKSMLASCGNISYLRALESAIQYVNLANFRLIQHAPTNADLLKVKSRSEIIFRKQGHLYFIYFAGDEPESCLNKKLKNHNDFLAKLAWPTVSQSLVIESKGDLTNVTNAAKDAMVSEAIMQEYTKVVPYQLLRRKPVKADLDLVAAGNIIIFSEENTDEATSYHLYLKNQDSNFDTVALEERLSIFDLLGDDVCYQIDSTHAAYREVAEFSTGCVIKQRLRFSNDNIKLRLSVFGGLGYVSDNSDQEMANFARIVHLHQIVKDYYDQKNHAVVLQLTEKFSENNIMLINNIYKLPPHLAWQLIVNYRLATLVQSIDHLTEFSGQYQEYSKYIYDSANESNPWYSAHWKSVKESLRQVLSLAMYQFVSAAYNAPNPKDKLNYLSFITQAYDYCDNWYDVLKDDELKYWAGVIYFGLGDKENCRKFFERINDLSALVQSKKDRDFTANTLAILDDISSAQHKDILLRAASGDFVLDDERLLLHALELINKKEFLQAKSFLENSRNFQDKHVARAYYIFLSSGKSDLMDALRILLTEESKSLYYWMTLENIIERCIESTKYSPRQATQARTHAKLYGWRVICLNYIQKFNLNFEYKVRTSELLENALDCIQKYIRHQHKQPLSMQEVSKICNERIELGHQAMRGENEMNILSELEVILQDISFDYKEADAINKYLPLDVPSDSDCAFHILGISRKEGINLLLQHVKSQVWVSKVIFGDLQRKDVINILLDDLAFKNNKLYDRSQESFADNIQLVVAYLQSLSGPGIWLAHNQGSCSVIDALALLLSKNLRIFVVDDAGVLSLSSSNIHNTQFETIDVLHTSAQGFALRLSDLNHFIQLKKLPLLTVELDDQEEVRSRSTSTTSRVSTQSIFKYEIAKPLKRDNELGLDADNQRNINEYTI